MSEQLYICPRCLRAGFYEKGLRTHVCRSTQPWHPRRRLTAAELQAALGVQPSPPAATAATAGGLRASCTAGCQAFFVKTYAHGGTYLATACGQRASSTNQPKFAALRCAAKVLRCPEEQVVISEIRQGSRYLARKKEKS